MQSTVKSQLAVSLHEAMKQRVNLATRRKLKAPFLIEKKSTKSDASISQGLKIRQLVGYELVMQYAPERNNLSNPGQKSNQCILQFITILCTYNTWYSITKLYHQRYFL